MTSQPLAPNSAPPPATRERDLGGFADSGVPFTLRHEDIAAEAYAVWVARGCPTGSAVDDWLEAERRLTEAARDGGEAVAGSAHGG